MEHTDAKGRIMDALSGDRPDIPPVAIFTQSSTVSQMDAVDSPWPLAHTSPTAMASLGSAQHTMFGFDSVRVPFCVTVEADALGCDVDLGGRISSPTVMRGFKLDPFGGETDDPSSLPSIDDFLSDDRTQCVSAAVDILSHRFENVPVVAGITGPLTVLSQMVGAENMVLGTVMCPDLVRRWSRELSVHLMGYIGSLEDSGADVILLGEASGSPDLIDPLMFMNLSGDFIGKMSRGRSKRVLHMCGDVSPVLDTISDLGFSGLSLEGIMNPYDIVEKVRGRTALVGNIGPVEPLLIGSPEDVSHAARMSLDAGFDIITPGCGVPVQTPDRNLDAILDVRR